MPRPLSWLPRLHIISRAIQNSVLSHYDRHDLEKLFEVQPRSAQKLLEMLPTVSIGTSRLVEREALSSFLDRVSQSNNVGDLLQTIRQERVPRPRKLRSLVRRDTVPVEFASLPESIVLARGRLEIEFETVEQLAEAMYAIARMLEEKGEEFAEMFERKTTPPLDQEAHEAGVLVDPF